MTFGEKLQLLRKQKGLSQEQLSQQLNVSRQAISKWELDSSSPDIQNVIEISNLFGVTTDYLLKDEYLDIEYIKSNPNNDLENNNNNKTSMNNNNNKNIKLIIGLSCIAFSTITTFIIWILSKVYPANIVFYNETTKTWKVGMDNFIFVHGLEQFMILIYMLFIVGLLLLIYKPIMKVIDKQLNI